MATKKPPASPHKQPKEKAKRRPRRSAQEIINALIDAATIEFELNGYAGAKTAAIAKRADVVEALIFNHFGSKANLFQRAVFKPLNDQFANFQATIDPQDAEMSVRGQFVAAQQEFIKSHSRMFMSLIMNEAYDPDGIGGVNQIDGLQEYLDKMAKIVEAKLEGEPAVSPRLLARISFATMLSCVLYQKWLFPSDMSEEEIRTAVAKFVAAGATVVSG